MKFNLAIKNINSPLPKSLKSECKKATKILSSFIDPGQGLDIIIPSSILEKAKGLAIFTVLKAGFLFSGRVGSGIVVARLADGSWSAPSAIVTGGIGAGGQVGAELTDFVLVLNTKEAVKTFSNLGNITLGGNISLAAGPVGRNVEASGSVTFKNIAAIYSYSKTRGLFAGVSLEGSVIVNRNDANEKLYGQRYTAKELLNGSVPPPIEADALYRALNARFHNLGNMSGRYQRQDENNIKSNKSTTISVPGTLRVPGIRGHAGSYEAPLSHFTPLSDPTLEVNKMQKYYPNEYNTGNSMSPSAPLPSLDNNQQQSYKRRDVKLSPHVPNQSTKPIKVRALYSFTGLEQGDLSFNAGDSFIVTEKTNSQDDWWTGRFNGQLGYFPANYVELL